MIDEYVYSRLSALAGGRVHYARMPQTPAYPALVITIVSSDEQYSDEGHAGIAEYRVQIDAWGETRADVAALMVQAKAAMRGSDVDFSVVNEYDNLREREQETDLFRASTDFICWRKN